MARNGNRGSWLLPLAVFLILAGCTLAAWLWQSRLQLQMEEDANVREAATVTAEIRERLRLHVQFLRSVQAFASTQPTLDLQPWKRFASVIDTKGSLAGMYAFAYAPAVRGDDLAQLHRGTRPEPPAHSRNPTFDARSTQPPTQLMRFLILILYLTLYPTSFSPHLCLLPVLSP